MDRYEFDRALANFLTARLELHEHMWKWAQEDEGGFVDGKHKPFYNEETAINKNAVGFLNAAAGLYRNIIERAH